MLRVSIFNFISILCINKFGSLPDPSGFKFKLKKKYLYFICETTIKFVLFTKALL